MELNELMVLLNKEFQLVFKYEVDYDPNDFIIKYKLFADNKFIGKMSDPRSTYNDICYMFGGLAHDVFYNDIIKPSEFKIPNEFNNVEEFAKNEIIGLYFHNVKEMLKICALK